MRIDIRSSLLLSALLLCCACGKRPDVLDAPEGSDPKAWPHTYPDTTTDPAGVPVPKAENTKNRNAE
jgi:hypothetical protein